MRVNFPSSLECSRLRQTQPPKGQFLGMKSLSPSDLANLEMLCIGFKTYRNVWEYDS